MSAEYLMVQITWGHCMWTIWSYGIIKWKWILWRQACLSCT